MDRSAAAKMIRDLRRTADSLESANCPSCVRNGLLIPVQGCTICGGSGQFNNRTAAESYRAKATLIIKNVGLSELDLTTGGVVYGNMTRTPSDPTTINPNAYNRCTRCYV